MHNFSFRSILGKISERPGMTAKPLNGLRNAVHVYIFRGKAYVPKTARARAGFSVFVDPICTASMDDKAAFLAAIAAQLNKMPVVPTPSPQNSSLPLKGLPLKSWRQIDRQCAQFALDEYPDKWIVCEYKRRPDRGMERDTLTEGILSSSLATVEAAEMFYNYIRHRLAL